MSDERPGDNKVTQLRPLPAPDAETVTIEVTPMIAALLKVVTLGMREQHKSIAEQVELAQRAGAQVMSPLPSAPVEAEVAQNAFRIGLEHLASRVLCAPPSPSAGTHAYPMLSDLCGQSPIYPPVR
jgi:hypothetical protein